MKQLLWIIIALSCGSCVRPLESTSHTHLCIQFDDQTIWTCN